MNVLKKHKQINLKTGIVFIKSIDNILVYTVCPLKWCHFLLGNVVVNESDKGDKLTDKLLQNTKRSLINN